MPRFRRVCAVAALLTLFLAALPAPASAAPWRSGIEDFIGVRLHLRIVTWVLGHLPSGRGVTNATAAEGATILP